MMQLAGLQSGSPCANPGIPDRTAKSNLQPLVTEQEKSDV
jgi:hypothetical protein